MSERDLEELVGVTGARKFMKRYGGLKVYVPKPRATKGRDLLIQRALRNGDTYREVALRFGVNKSTVYRASIR